MRKNPVLFVHPSTQEAFEAYPVMEKNLQSLGYQPYQWSEADQKLWHTNPEPFRLWDAAAEAYEAFNHSCLEIEGTPTVRIDFRDVRSLAHTQWHTRMRLAYVASMCGFPVLALSNRHTARVLARYTNFLVEEKGCDAIIWTSDVCGDPAMAPEGEFIDYAELNAPAGKPRSGFWRWFKPAPQNRAYA